MAFRISHIHEYDRFIAIDLGSYRVRASLYSIRDGALFLEGSAVVKQHHKSLESGITKDLSGAATAIDRAMHEAAKRYGTIPDDIIVGFSPHNCIHDQSVSQYVREDPDDPITMHEVDIMIEKIEKSSLLRAKAKAKSEYGILYDDIRLISSTLTSIMIDGKIVQYPIGLKGKYIRINVLNIFTIASEYNMMRSIVSSLKKKAISLVPKPLLFAKLIEKSHFAEDETILIDIGYSDITIMLYRDQEIVSFETFTIGSKMFMDILTSNTGEHAYTLLENIITAHTPADNDRIVRETAANEYFDYVIDVFLSFLQKEKETLSGKHICISGGIFDSKWLEKLFLSILSERVGYTVSYHYLKDILSVPLTNDTLLTTSLAILGNELLHIKKDPIIRILRYTLYHYE